MRNVRTEWSLDDWSPVTQAEACLLRRLDLEAVHKVVRQSEDVEVFDLIEEEGDEEIPYVVGPAEKQSIKELLEYLLDQEGSLFYWEEVKCPVQEV